MYLGLLHGNNDRGQIIAYAFDNSSAFKRVQNYVGYVF
jgi:hypothetical protein